MGLANHTVLIARDGTERPIDDSAAPIRDEAGDPVGAVLVFRDVTERKRAEQAQAERGRLAALRADVAMALAGGDSLGDVLQRSADAIVRHLDAAFARIWTLDEAAGVLELRASAGLYTHLDGPHGRIGVGEYKIGRIAESRRPHLTNAVADDPNVSDPEWASREGMVAFAGYPLAVEGRVVGVMALFSRHTLSETVLADLAPLADAIAQCIERKRGEQALRESEERHRFLADLAAANQAVTDPEELMAARGADAGPSTSASTAARTPRWRTSPSSSSPATTPTACRASSAAGRWPRSGPSWCASWRRTSRTSWTTWRPTRVPGPTSPRTVRRRSGRSSASPSTRGGSSPPRWPSTRKSPGAGRRRRFELVCTVVGRCWESIERARVARDLRESEERQRTLADNLPSGFIYQIVHAADGSSRFTLRQRGRGGALRGDAGGGGRGPGDPPRAHRGGGPGSRAGRGGRSHPGPEAVRLPVPRARHDGQVRWLHCRSAPRDLPGGSAVWDGIAVDITERVEMEQALREADRKKDEFIALLGHELRNPLAPIRNGLQVMRLAGGDANAVAQAREMMDRQLGHMVRLIDDLLDVSRIGRNKMELRRARVLARRRRRQRRGGRPPRDRGGRARAQRLASRPSPCPSTPT